MEEERPQEERQAQTTMTKKQQDEAPADDAEGVPPELEDGAEVAGEEELSSDEKDSGSAGSGFGEDDSFTSDSRVRPETDSSRSANRDRPLGDFASRLLRVGAEAVNQTTGRLREAGEDVKPREILSGAVRMTAKGREELVGLVAKEVRMYLEKLRVGEELRALMTDHSLEIQASVRLKPLGGETPEPEEDS
jgi:hypothetical protein